MGQRHAYVAEHGGVGKVALQARHWQLGGKMLEQGVGHAEVALGIFKVDGIDLVGHRRGAYLACLDALLEVIHRYIAPEVAVEVHDNGVKPLESIEHGCELVVVRYLGGVFLALKAEFLRKERFTESTPVDLREGGTVCVEVACRAAELAGHCR